MVKIVWTEISINDLEEISEFIALDSIIYSQITIHKIYNRVQILIDHPYSGKILPEINKKKIRELIEGNYRIIYRIKSVSQIDILRIYHTSRALRKRNLF